MCSAHNCHHNHNQRLKQPGVPNQASHWSTGARSAYPQKRYQPGLFHDNDDDDYDDNDDDDDDDDNDDDDDDGDDDHDDD